MVITHRHIIAAAKTSGGSLLPSSSSRGQCDDDTDKKHFGGKHSTKQLGDKSPAVFAALLFLSFLIPMLIFGRHRPAYEAARPRIRHCCRHPINANHDGTMPKPWGWQRWGYYDFEQNFNCAGYLNDGTKPVPNMEFWETMLKAYNQEVDPTYKFDAVVPPTEGYRHDENGPPPYYAKLSPGKGRGLFASRDIQKGEIVHDGTKSDVVFPDGLTWKRFVFALPRKMACDQVAWTFTQPFEEDGPMRVVSSLNIAILMNEGDKAKDVNVEPQDGNGAPSDYSSVFYALRDIKKDEEILMNYAAYDTDYNAAGIGAQSQTWVIELVETCLNSLGWRKIGATLGLGR
ncbi:hypothetical protein ACHAWT_005926 [Skeletonema menzelii]